MQPTIDQRVVAGALQLAYSRLPQSIVMAVCIGFGFVALLAQFFPMQLLAIWIGVMAIAYGARLLIWFAWRRAEPTAADTRRWQMTFAFGAALAGASWGFGGALLLPAAGNLESMLLIVPVLVVSATAANTLAAQFVAMVLFTGSAVLPVAIVLAYGGGSIERMTALALCCSFVALCIAGRQSSRTTMQLIRAEINLSLAFVETAAAQRHAEATSLAKSQFLANMSHEVRTPLNGVLGLAELLGRGQLSTQQHAQVQLLRQSGEHLLRIVNEILDLSKIEAGRFELVDVDFDLHALLAECAELIRPQAERKGLAFSLRIEPRVPQLVAGDAHRLRQVLLNLLSNAAKFTELGSIALRVEGVSAQPAEPAQALERTLTGMLPRARICFAVEDTGIGVPVHAAERIFDAFTQAEESADRRFSGTGLGLALCRQLAALMGGTVTHAPRAGGGSVFTVTLALQVRSVTTGRTQLQALTEPWRNATARPAVERVTRPVEDRTAGRAIDVATDRRPEVRGPEAPATEPPDRYTGRILLAEDNPVNQEVMLAMLESFGIEVHCVGNGHEAVRAAMEGGFDMVLMDCQMPLMDGYAATGAIRAAGARDRRFGPLPIVALTANAFAEDRERALAAGMDDFVAKPVIMGELHRVLSAWLPGAGNHAITGRPPPPGPALPGLRTAG